MCAFFFFNDTATTEIYTLSLHDALPISYPKSGPYPESPMALEDAQRTVGLVRFHAAEWHIDAHKIGVPLRRVKARSEEHTSELQSHLNLVCRLLLEKKKKASDADTVRHT